MLIRGMAEFASRTLGRTGEPEAEPADSVEGGGTALRRAVRRIGIALLFLDYGSLSFLLWRLDIAWWVAVPLGVSVGLFTTYELQWRFLLSPDAYRRAGSKQRFILAAAVIVVVNLGASSLLILRLWYSYLAVRVVAACLGAYAFAHFNVRRLMAKEPATTADRSCTGSPPR